MHSFLRWGAFLALTVVIAAGPERPTDLINASFDATVIRVVDGDTVDVRLESSRVVRLRLWGVDTPERGEPFSQEATRFSRALLFSKQVHIQGKDVDGHGRLVARITTDETLASEALVSAGLACTFHRYVTDKALDAAWDTARQSRTGFWGTGARRPRCVQRELRSLNTARAVARGPFIGNSKSKVYHSPSCPNATCRSCTVSFDSSAEASAAGFRPAGDCLGR